jgi:hypothetical protein
MNKEDALVDPAYVTVIFVRVPIEIGSFVLFRKTQNIPAIVAFELALERVVIAAVGTML